MAVAGHALFSAVPAVIRPSAGGGQAWLAGGLGAVTGISLLTGLFTPVFAAVATLGYLALDLWSLPGLRAVWPLASGAGLDLSLISLALVLLGPGAYSLDSRLFGRREIVITDYRR